jgi:predicted esterase
MRTILTVFLSLLGCGLLGTHPEAFSQDERYELGKRLRRFEEAWATATPELQLKSTPVMQQAVGSFFGLQLKAAAAKLDEAWLAVGRESFNDWQRALIPYRLKLRRAVFIAGQSDMEASEQEPSNAEPTVSLLPFYGGERNQSHIPSETIVAFDIVNKSEQIIKRVESNWQAACDGLELTFQNVPPGDYQLRACATHSGVEFRFPSTDVSVIENLDERLEKLEQVRSSGESGLNSTLRNTLGEYLELIRQGRENFSAETDYPYHRMLRLAESFADQPDNAAVRISDAAKSSDLWLVLTENRKRVPVRIRAPQNQTEKLPVLFLFHGAGGSENMFFETYGAGDAVRLGLERGWLVVAPRQGLMGLSLNCEQILNALEPFFNIDRTKVFLIGHSMGAAQVIQQVSINPDLPRAAAAIGGGRPTRDPKKIANVPWFVSAGELDFGRAGAKSFHQSLVNAGATNAKYVEYPGIEHMVIVQAALPKTFEFFDQVLETSE